MIMKLFITSVTFFSLIFPLMGLSKETLTIYTYDSFITDWGPGPVIKENFEKKCDCEINFIGLDSSIGILGRLQIEGKTSKADIVLGLDTNLMSVAKETGLFAPHTVDVSSKVNLPKSVQGKWEDNLFVPFDWGYFAFIYDSEKLKEPPQSMQALVEDDDVTIIIQDPRTATPGLGLLLWIKSIYGEDSSVAWKNLSEKIVTTTKGWWDAYSLFLNGEADMVLSYSTSPAYHMIAEGKNNYKAAEFKEGHYVQIEVAGLLKSSSNKDLARSFLEFILTDDFQSVIPTTNWMYPVITINNPKEFSELIKPKNAFLFDSKKVNDNRISWIQEWLEGLTQQ